MRIQQIKEGNDPERDNLAHHDGVRPVRRVAATAVALGLAFTGLAACSSDGTGDPLTESDSGVIVEDAPADDGTVVEDPPADDGAVEGEGEMEDGEMEEGG